MGQCVTDLERSKAFYVDVLGFEPWRELTFPDEPSDRLLRLTPPMDMTACYLRLDGFVLELLHFAGSGAAPLPFRERTMNEPGLTHVSVSVDDIDETCRRVVEYGGEVLEDTSMDGMADLHARSRRSARRAAADELRRTDRGRGLIAVDLGLRDRVAIVTGASKGIGRQVAVDLGAEGCHVVVCGRDEAALRDGAAAVERSGARAIIVAVDMELHETRPTTSCSAPSTSSAASTSS